MLQLIVQYYQEPRPDRKHELDYCLRRNLADSRIASVHDLQAAVAPPEDIRTHAKYRQVPWGEWLTFAEAFRYANERLAGQYVALANLDVFLSAEFPVGMLTTMSPHVVLALARWEYDAKSEAMWLDPTFARFDMAVSQDMWVFKSPIQVQNCDFKLGTLGCDHAIAHRLHVSGYIPVNDCQRFRICHFDRCRGKSGADGLAFHQQRPEIQSYPGSEGGRLVPMLQDDISLDATAKRLGLGPLSKYRALLDLWNANLRLRNFAEPNEP